MLKEFLNHITHHKLCAAGDKVLLAVSGGLDSVVMLHLFTQAGFTVGVAHCNFQLRGMESEQDEVFVQKLCKSLNVTFHNIHFETEKFANENSLSVQMAARELRYRFFEDLQKEHSYPYIATAHHLNDSVETVLLNLVRGTGIDGLKGIPVKHNTIIRPMLFASRDAIEKFASLYSLEWREDASNASDKYHRNLIRHQVIPLLKSINPNLEEGFNDTVERVNGMAFLAGTALAAFKEKHIRESEGQQQFDKSAIHQHPYSEVVLWELLKDKGFNFDQCKEITTVDHQSGKVFYAGMYQLTVNRDHFIVSEVATKQAFKLRIDNITKDVINGGERLSFKVLDRGGFSLNKNALLAQMDFDTIGFPLIWRRWKPGDQLIPLGMKSHKKISDFLIDAKVSVVQKNFVSVIESGGTIAWIVGFRIDDRFKVTENTKRVLIIECLQG